MAVVSISAFKNRIALVASGGKKSRGRYGDGCIYRQKGRSDVFMLTWYERQKLPDGSTKIVKKSKSSGSTDRSVAQRQLRSILTRLGGRRPLATDPDKVSYDDLRANFIQYLVLHNRRSLKKDRDGNVTLNTLPRLDRTFSGWRSHEITVDVLKHFRTTGRQEGLSDARLNRYMSTLRKMFRQAIKDELITAAECPSYFPVTSEPNEARGAIFIEPQWYEALKDVLKEPLRSAFILAYHGGVRVEELQRLRWSHLDMKSRVVNLTGDITKTGKPRTVFLAPDFDRKATKFDELVFPLGDRRERWRTACVKVGAGHFTCKECKARCDGSVCPRHGKLPAKRRRYHGILLRHCRHTFVRNASDAGLEEKRIMQLTGHQTRATFDRYNIGREKDALEAGRVLTAFHAKKKC